MLLRRLPSPKKTLEKRVKEKKTSLREKRKATKKRLQMNTRGMRATFSTNRGEVYNLLHPFWVEKRKCKDESEKLPPRTSQYGKEDWLRTENPTTAASCRDREAAHKRKKEATRFYKVELSSRINFQDQWFTRNLNLSPNLSANKL